MRAILLCLCLLSKAYPQGIKGYIRDSETKHQLPARIVITNDTGFVYNSYYSRLKGFFTEEDGSFSIDLQKGTYTMEVFHGIDYLSQKFSFTVNGRITDTVIYLKRWYNLKQKGWYNGDGHDHLYTDLKPDTAMMKLVRRICVAQGVDFMCTAQGWSGYNDATWREGYAKFSDDKFLVHYGSEMPKYRTGHTWWLGQKSTRGMFDATMDTTYEYHYYQSDQGTTWNFDQLKFPQIPDIEIVSRFKKEDGSLAIAGHPTSWWMQQRGTIEKYVTNVACNLSFSLLSGKIWDGLVAMGYNHDHYFYQNLWFNVLNQGYRMPSFSELDGGLGKDDKFYYGSMRTYFHVDGQFTIDKMVKAAKEGRSFLTSGPIVLANVDRKYVIGDVIPADIKTHQLNIEAYASGEKDDYLSYVVVFRNGRILKLYDLRSEKQRHFSAALTFKEDKKSWYIVKVYGRRAWKNPRYIDVMNVCSKQSSTEKMDNEADVAFTNPFYFRHQNDIDPSPLFSKVELLFSEPVRGSVEVLVAGAKIKTIVLSGNSTAFSMPVNALLKFNAEGHPAVYRSLYLDYLPHRDLIEELASGRWREKYPGIKFSPGEVPWDAFNFEKTKKLLADVKWEIDLTPNERDVLFREFGN